MRFLITFSVAAEFAPWSARHPFVPYEFDDKARRREFDLFRANIGSNEITVLLTGIGGENAKNAMRTVNLEMPDVCISSGLAGALDRRLKPGAIVVAHRCETIDRKLKTTSDAALVELAVASDARATEVLATSDRIVATARAKEELSARGNVVDMESSYILSAASAWGLPVVAVRVISDAADEDLPVDFERVADSRGRVKVGGLLKELAGHPHRLPLLVRFGRQSRAAAVTLADFLDGYIPEVAEKWQGMRASDIEEVSAT